MFGRLDVWKTCGWHHPHHHPHRHQGKEGTLTVHEQPLTVPAQIKRSSDGSFIFIQTSDVEREFLLFIA